MPDEQLTFGFLDEPIGKASPSERLTRARQLDEGLGALADALRARGEQVARRAGEDVQDGLGNQREKRDLDDRDIIPEKKTFSLAAIASGMTA